MLGTGIDIIYPSENLGLYRQIAETGAVLSEFPFGRKADRQSFAMRNRIVSGISEAVVVVAIVMLAALAIVPNLKQRIEQGRAAAVGSRRDAARLAEQFAMAQAARRARQCDARRVQDDAHGVPKQT